MECHDSHTQNNHHTEALIPKKRQRNKRTPKAIIHAAAIAAGVCAISTSTHAASSRIPVAIPTIPRGVASNCNNNSSKDTDYYQISGVTKTSTMIKIKKAYRKKAIQHIPTRVTIGNCLIRSARPTEF
mmetsp:Transcript_49993/g.50360  ORF Transcript_49993/g.50360 Transcript_49993/m.50360 type:complete len:128 (-) Transcript_49993:987-1370(-)